MRLLAPFLVHNFLPEIIAAIVLEVASRLSTERTEETRSISHTIWIGFPVKRLIEMRIE